MSKPKTSLIVKKLRRFPRLILAIAAGLVVLLTSMLFSRLNPAFCVLIAWNSCAFLYLLLSWHFIATSQHHDLLQRARDEDAGGAMIFVIAVLASVLSITSIVMQLGGASEDDGWMRVIHVGLPILTLVNSWAFIHVAFSFHYAHTFYSYTDYEQSPCLIFPGKAAPDYMDFVYFSFVIGTSGQTADVSMASPTIRRIGLFHCVLAYFFNAAVLSLIINIAAGLIK